MRILNILFKVVDLLVYCEIAKNSMLGTALIENKEILTLHNLFRAKLKVQETFAKPLKK